MQAKIPVVGFAAWSGTGKTSLLKKLVPILKDRGLRVGIVKHAHHDFDVDTPGKDSYVLRKAGARQMLLASRRRWVLMEDKEEPAEPRLQDMLNLLDQTHLDIILVEGFKQEAFPKIEIYRSETGKPALYPEDPDIVAVASDGELPLSSGIAFLDLNDPAAIAEFVIHRFAAGEIKSPG